MGPKLRVYTWNPRAPEGLCTFVGEDASEIRGRPGGLQAAVPERTERVPGPLGVEGSGFRV